MKKRKILCLLLAAALTVSVMPGCKNNSSNTSSGVKENAKLKDESSADLTFIFPEYKETDEDSAITKGIKEYNDKYGVTVDVIQSSYDDWQQKIMQNINAGTPISVIHGDNAYYPLFAMKQYVQPVSDYVDLTANYISVPGMDAYFKYKGEYYCAAGATVSPSVLFYNKDMIQQYGLEDPVELYKEGNWTFDTFRDMCKAVTDNDQKIWGLANCYSWFFLGCNHTALCKINDDGKYELNFDDPAVKDALEYTQDAYYGTNGGKKWRGLDGGDIFQSWFQGRDLFVNEYEWCETKNILDAKNSGQLTFDYGVVGLPYGPNNTDHYNICNAGGYSIGTGCPNPYHAGQLIEILLNADKNDLDEKMKDIPQDHKDMYAELAQKPYNDTYYDSCLPTCGSGLLNLVCGGANISSALQTVKDQYQGYVDDANNAANE